MSHVVPDSFLRRRSSTHHVPPYEGDVKRGDPPVEEDEDYLDADRAAARRERTMVTTSGSRKHSYDFELNPIMRTDKDHVVIKADFKGDHNNDDSATDGEHEPPTFSCHGLLGTMQERCCSLQRWKNRLPITKWLPHYSLLDLHGDVVAGITVALTVIPQGLALATLAGLPPQYGLYTAFMGSFMYTFFGSCKDLTIGPTAIMSIMTAEYVSHGGGPTYAILLTFLAGIIQVLMGVLNLGFIVEFISGPVISGFTSAAAITIASTQLKTLFGMRYKAEHFLDIIYKFFTSFNTMRLGDSLMGVLCVVLLLVVRHFKDVKFSPDSRLPCKARKMIETVWWTLATARNAIVVLFCAVLAWYLQTINIKPFDMTDDVQGGLPPFALPEFSSDRFNPATNQTISLDFLGIVRELGAGIPIIALLSILESVAIAKAFAKGKSLDSTQEMIAIGICNIMGSFVSSYPSTGSFSRTAINHNSGVRTPMGGIFTGVTVILSLLFVAPYFTYIPKAALSAIIITAVIFMVHYQDIPGMWRTNKVDLLPFSATFIMSFVIGLEYGIIIGVVISLALLMYEHARPRVRISEKMTASGIPYIYVSPDRSVLFPSSMYTSQKITKALPDTSESCLRFIVVDGLHINSSDYTTALTLKTLSDTFSKQQVTLIYTNLKPSIVDSVRGARPSQFHHCKNEKELDALITACVSQWRGNGDGCTTDIVQDAPWSIQSAPNGAVNPQT
ncbi:sodium-independent sulfate anion transporter-like isoform X2 [Ornithodoros turicata]|uniref:sodium-independent sulfate anion transporter-like isoform X2 n=1 Tax=Ornithodoros turicata TaxID=34597 RepID=UPI00313A0D9B